MGDYEVEIQEVKNAGFYGDVFYTDERGMRVKIGQTPVSGMRPTVEELRRRSSGCTSRFLRS